MKKPNLALTIAITEHIDGIVPGEGSETWKVDLVKSMKLTGLVSETIWQTVRWCRGKSRFYITGNLGTVCFTLKRAPKKKASGKTAKKAKRQEARRR